LVIVQNKKMFVCLFCKSVKISFVTLLCTIYNYFKVDYEYIYFGNRQVNIDRLVFIRIKPTSNQLNTTYEYILNQFKNGHLFCLT